MKLFLTLVVSLFSFFATASDNKTESKNMSTLLNFTVNSIDGKPVSFSQYKGKTLLFVNVASRCGYTKQYTGLEALNKKYKDKGLVILGFPSNDFMGQEPGTEKEIKEFCQTKYNVSFDLFEKIKVKGSQAHALYKYLAENSTGDGHGSPGWNFHKYLLTKKGEIIGYKSGTTPEDLDSVIASQL
jgi:glutathione peroxidase